MVGLSINHFCGWSSENYLCFSFSGIHFFLPFFVEFFDEKNAEQTDHKGQRSASGVVIKNIAKHKKIAWLRGVGYFVVGVALWR